MRINFLYKFLFSFVLLAGIQLNLIAQFEEGKVAAPTGSKLIGTSIATGATMTADYVASTEDFHKIKNVISFYINETNSLNTYFASSFTATVNFDLEITVGGVLLLRPNKTLTVFYDTTTGAKYNVRAYMVLPEQAENVKVTVTGINIVGATGWTPLSVLQLDNEIHVLQYYNSLGTTTFTNPLSEQPSNTIDPGKSDELKVSWMWDHEHYNMSQLEWAFIDSNMIDNYTYNLNDSDNIFKNNSTRVDIDPGKENYKIPLLYPAGNLFYRVRPALRRNSGNVITGAWSFAKMYVIKGHEDSLNWQSSTSFAENQKYKTVIQYFDGSLRSRQTVTKDNSAINGNTVVAETIYDLQGRPNVQILPTPTSESTIKYFKDFNLFAGQQIGGMGDLRHYDDPAKYFDLSIVACDTVPRLDINTGNGRYYSASNDWLTGANAEEKSKFIPNAQGYAYTETRFMDDATERVRSQGGVGIDHQIGSGHETKYWYGKPLQTEMDALFGTEVGDAIHYSKNMVQDANKQVSVSYVDMHGRTIATALAGNPTAGIDSILNDTDYPQAGGLITDSLITSATNIIKGRLIESISTILVATPNTKYDFAYELNPAIFSQLNCDSQQICFDCKYDLEISIKSEDCGTAPIIIRYNNLQIVASSNPCDSSVGFSGDGFSEVRKLTFSEILGIGSHTIRKTLTINDSMFQVRRDSALKAFLCTTEDSIYQSVYTLLSSTSNCGATNSTVCDSCVAKLGTDFTEYKNKYLVSIGLSTSDTSTSLLAKIRNYYTQDSLGCANVCGQLNPELGTLQSLRTQMRNDMMPFTGQYAILADSMKAPSGTTDYARMEARFNIFSDHYIMGGSSTPKAMSYQHPLTESGTALYLTDENRIDSSIHGHDEIGQLILDTITPPAFAGIFQTSWTNSLIKYHPEYSKLVFAETSLQSSYDWVDKVQSCETYAAALSAGFVNPTNNSSATPYPSSGGDPFFSISANSARKDTMNAKIFNALVTGGPSIWQIANSIVLCATKSNSERPDCIMSQLNSGIDPLITDPNQRNQVWEQFRALYLANRNEIVLTYINSQPNVLGSVDMDSLVSQGKQLAFANLQQIATQNKWTAWTSVMSGDTAAIRLASVSSDTTDNCKAQRPFWKAKLLQCERLIILLKTGIDTDSVTVNTIVENILDSMVMVCHNSITVQQPLGASNVNPAYSGVPQNFERVINGVLFNHGIDTAGINNYFCNPYTIDFPKPFGKNPPLWANTTNIIDTCACKRFSELKSEAKILGFDTLNLSGTLGMNQFLMTNYQDSLTTMLWQGLQKCNIGLIKDTCIVALGVDSSAIPPCANCPADMSSCGTPILYSVAYVNGSSTNNVKVTYSNSCGSFNWKIIATNIATNAITYFTIDCGAIMNTTVSLPAFERYKIQLSTGSAHGTCYDTSVAHILSASVQDCSTLYSPINLQDVIVMPPFLSCGYQKPCISCAKLDSLANEFKTIFPTFNGVPYTLSDSITEVQGNQNDLLARFLNYRTGFSKNTIEYLTAYQACKSDSGCGVNSGVNNLILTARTSPFPSEYVARMSITVEGGFESNTGDNFLIHINPALDTCTGPSSPNITAICASFKPINAASNIYIIDTVPCKYVQTQAEFISKILYTKMQDSLIANFDSLYMSTCLSAQYKEKFYVKYVPKEYHYTLYHYDQAGNLVKTLPPAAVKPNFSAGFLDSVIKARNGGADLNNYANNDSLATHYRYNTLNQVIAQKTPDAGISDFWYDRLGRLVVSQNAKQQAASLYSYTLYDALGRITEVGEKPQAIAMNQDTSQNETALQAWVNGTGVKAQITKTIYDEVYTPLSSTVNGISGLYQKNLRNRVSYTYLKNLENQSANWNAATFYTYDIHGNVDTLLQDYQTGMGNIPCSVVDTSKGNRFKKMVYSYDLISGKVNDVAYQPNQSDQFYHRYDYDAENRLIKVQTSKDKIYWERDALYDYYRHGPLAKTILGHNQVQGIDYAYTIQGWLKGVNSTATLNSTTGTSYDMGQDGIAGSLIARDAYGFSLNYFTGDYKSINTTVTPFATIPMALTAGINGVATGSPLFNGNIGAMAVNIPKLGDPKVYGYRYDQLNRIVRMDAFTGLNNTNNIFTNSAPTDDYHEEISYDPNGNIKTYLRNGTTQGGSSLAMDKLTYQYEKLANGQLKSNKLRYVHDQVADGNYPSDINSQKASTFSVTDVQSDISGSVAGDNYQYDAIGNLIKDAKEGIDNIEWTIYGKISKITKSDTTISYTYDASGNRVSKIVQTPASGDSTYYVRDASGNVMSVYNKKGTANLLQTEVHLYGSSRLGVYNVNLDVQNCSNTSSPITIFTRGNKFFELSNHLGNVLVTVSDKKLQHTTNNTTVDYYNADVVTANDYYPFGSQMPGRKYSQANSGYRYGFNGKENDNEVKGEGNQQDYGLRIYDLRLGKFLSVDPLTAKYPMLTPYQFAGNMPIKFIDLDGAEPANNPSAPGTKEKVAMATVETILYKTSENSFKKNLFSSGIWKAADIEGTYSCGPNVLKGAQSTENGAYVTDNTDIGPANKLNIFVSSASTFNVNESNSKKFNDYEAFVVGQLMNNFISGQGPENYNFPTNGIISSKFFESDIFKKAMDEYNGGILKPNETKQYNFGIMDLFKDAVRNWTPFNITGMTGSGTITMTPTEKGVLVKIFNITSLSSGALIKNPSDPSTYPNSYVRDPTKETAYGNISQTFNLFIPKESSLLKKKGN